MKTFKTIVAMLAVSALAGLGSIHAEPDSNFRIFLCIGQSNMTGQGTIEMQDKRNVSSRFQMMSPVGCDNYSHPKHQWSLATPPLCRCGTRLGPVDYFGRTLVKYLPSNERVGVIVVAIDGCRMDMFDPDVCKSYINYIAGESSLSWQIAQVREYPGSNPLKCLLETAKIAQKDGVISGILVHQGESDAYSDDWCRQVKKVYEYLLSELDLKADSVPLLAGEVLNPGQCAGANNTIDRLPQFINTAYVVSSQGCTGQSDNLHFDSAGYRKLGQRYAETYLEKFLKLDLARVEPVADDEIPEDAPVYSVGGYQLDSPQPGINIINGKKYLFE